MARAIELSRKGYGNVNPNPLVGAVIVRDNTIIGEGYHEYFGGPHAEINAIVNSGIAEGSTLFVTLEPCDHFGKTPPCTERIISEKINRVVIGMKDPNPLVNGKGIEKLKNADIKTEYGFLEEEIKRLNEVYIKYVTTGFPFCVMKTAMTLDGKISTFNGDSKWISNQESRNKVHEFRHRYSAIMAGVNTIIKDNPSLTERSGKRRNKQPLRIIVDTTGRTPPDSNALNCTLAPVVIATTARTDSKFIDEVSARGCEVIICPEKKDKVDLPYLFETLGKRGIDSILLEGGSSLNFSAIKEGLVDKVYSFISPKMLGGEMAYTPLGGEGFPHVKDAVTLKMHEVSRIDDDLLIESYVIKK